MLQQIVAETPPLSERCAICGQTYEAATCFVFRTLNGRPYGKHGHSPFVFVCPNTQANDDLSCIERAKIAGLVFHLLPCFSLAEDKDWLYPYIVNPWAVEEESLAAERAL